MCKPLAIEPSQGRIKGGAASNFSPKDKGRGGAALFRGHVTLCG
jgi:hypothetical protein